MKLSKRDPKSWDTLHDKARQLKKFKKKEKLHTFENVLKQYHRNHLYPLFSISKQLHLDLHFLRQ
jgi:hypothetical protein